MSSTARLYERYAGSALVCCNPRPHHAPVAIGALGWVGVAALDMSFDMAIADGCDSLVVMSFRFVSGGAPEATWILALQ